MSKIINNTYTHFIVFGIALFLIGLLIQVPGGALTTYETLDGGSTDSYAFDSTYSSIDEYVGGDAYNYIIGASLVAGKMAGRMSAKVVFIVGGIICLCFGLTFFAQSKKEKENLVTAVPCSETKGNGFRHDVSKSESQAENINPEHDGIIGGAPVLPGENQ